jgi:hypothetical protein
MSNFNKCRECGEWHYDNGRCAPEYFVYHKEYMGDEATSVRAHSHEDAAIKYAEYYNQDDYPLMNDTAQVKVEKDGVIKFFEVGAEPDIHYTSNEIDKLDSD